VLTPDDAAGRDLPWACLQAWLADAAAAGEPEPTAMALATADGGGMPSVRMVLFKGRDGDALRFFSGYASRKGRALEENPRAAVVFHWAGLRRQVRAEGRVEKLSAAASDEYFASRPRESRLAAVASPQSQPVASREALDARYVAAQREFAGVDIVRPESWGGYRLQPERWEFWVGAAHRLHDRWEMTRAAGRWRTVRLGP
jgi:pyridoxamine 5'-phosphate oxidase